MIKIIKCHNECWVQFVNAFIVQECVRLNWRRKLWLIHKLIQCWSVFFASHKIIIFVSKTITASTRMGFNCLTLYCGWISNTNKIINLTIAQFPLISFPVFTFQLRKAGLILWIIKIIGYYGGGCLLGINTKILWSIIIVCVLDAVWLML